MFVDFRLTLRHYICYICCIGNSLQASELEQCRSVLFATMHVKHLVLLTKAFVYPLEEHNPPPPPESPPSESPPPSPPSSRSLLSLYDRKTIVTTVLAELDQQHKTLLSQNVEGEGGEEEEAARMKESRYEKAALLVRARKQLKNWQCYLRAVAELEGSVASGEYR